MEMLAKLYPFGYSACVNRGGDLRIWLDRSKFNCDNDCYNKISKETNMTKVGPIQYRDERQEWGLVQLTSPNK